MFRVVQRLVKYGIPHRIPASRPFQRFFSQPTSNDTPNTKRYETPHVMPYQAELEHHQGPAAKGFEKVRQDASTPDAQIQYGTEQNANNQVQPTAEIVRTEPSDTFAQDLTTLDQMMDEENGGIDAGDALPPSGPNVNPVTGEVNGPKGPEPTRYGDFERAGRCFDF